MLVVIILAIIAIAMAVIVGVIIAYNVAVDVKGACAVPNWLDKIHKIILK